jgi:hypothetical protein
MDNNLPRRFIPVVGEERPLTEAEIGDIPALIKLIGCETIDVVILPHLGDPMIVMLVDDEGMIRDLPINKVATALYRQSRPDSIYAIHGNVVMCPDLDFSDDDPTEDAA